MTSAAVAQYIALCHHCLLAILTGSAPLDTDSRVKHSPPHLRKKMATSVDVEEGMQSAKVSAYGLGGADISIHWRRFVVTFLLICVVFILRRPDAVLNPQFWAEDGRLLFQSQMIHGGWSLALQPYRGYLIMETRLSAAF